MLQSNCNFHCALAIFMCHLRISVYTMTNCKVHDFMVFLAFANYIVNVMEKFTSFNRQVTMKSLFLQLCAVFSIHALEKPIPASRLQPRNFNPHPYHREGKAFLIAPADDYQNFEAERNYEELSRRYQKYVKYINNLVLL
jgi:hypothetical protein